MLTLTRRTRESVVLGRSDGLGHTIKVTVLRVRGGEVRLGFEGPPQVAVNRLEVWERARSPHNAKEKDDAERIGEGAYHVGAFGHSTKPVEVAESSPHTLARRKLSRRRLDGIATVFELCGEHFGRMHTLMRIDYSDRGVSGLADSVIAQGTPVTIGFQTPDCIAHLGRIITCIHSDDRYRVGIAFK